MTPELLPCPHCGEAPEYHEDPEPIGPFVTCKNGCSFFPRPNEWNSRATLGEGTYRTGGKLGRTIYFNDVLVGVMDTPGLGKLVVEALNRRTPDAASEKLRREVAFRLGEVASQLLVMPDIHAKALARQLDREAAKLLEGLEAETEGK